jgi:predicted  nucleic acid-binding Zn-ribbon protein
VDHINEQWLEFWAVLFQRYGYLPCDVFRRQFWGDHAVEFWYSQNLMVFCTKEHAAKTFPSEFLASGRPLSYPHPLTFLVNVARYRPLSARALDLECEGYQSVVHAYQNGDGTLPLLRVADATDEAGAPLFPRCRTLITDAQAEISARDAEVARLTGELEEARSEAAHRTEELEIGRQQNDRMLAELSGVREQTDRLLDELSHRRVEARQLAGELGNRQNQVRELSAEIDRLSHELTARNVEIRSLVSPLTARESEIARLKEELRARQEEFCHLSLALGAQVCEMRQRSERFTDKERALKEATAQVAARERELSALRNSLTRRATGRVRRWMRWLAGLVGEGRRTVRVLRSSGLFDKEYYLAQNPDVAAEGVDPIQHYVRSGAAEGRDPSRLFDTSAYLETHPELATSGINPLLHYVLYGDPDRHSQTGLDRTESTETEADNGRYSA